MLWEELVTPFFQILHCVR